LATSAFWLLGIQSPADSPLFTCRNFGAKTFFVLISKPKAKVDHWAQKGAQSPNRQHVKGGKWITQKSFGFPFATALDQSVLGCFVIGIGIIFVCNLQQGITTLCIVKGYCFLENMWKRFVAESLSLCTYVTRSRGKRGSCCLSWSIWFSPSSSSFCIMIIDLAEEFAKFAK